MNQAAMNFDDVMAGGICLHCKGSLPSNIKPHDECNSCGAMVYDLFFHYEMQPDELRLITNRYGELLDECESDKYELCKKFLALVEVVGYTFDYGLSGECNGLRKLDTAKVERDLIGKSVTKDEAKAVARRYSREIRDAAIILPMLRKTIDWSGKRGQGKRCGGTVKGGMCTLMGPEVYDGIDLSGFVELEMEPHRKHMNLNQFCLYARAKLYGCNHLESMMFAILNP